MAVLAAATRAQGVILARSPGMLATLAVIPLYSLVFFHFLQRHHREELATTVALTAFVMSLWAHAVFVASDVVDDDRSDGTLELSLLTPDRYLVALAVRTFTTTLLALPVLAEVVLIGRGLFGLDVTLHNPAVALPVAVLLVAGCASAALLVSGLMIKVRGARTLQNSLTYPFYLLGGLILPVGHLPAPFGTVAKGFFLSWATDLLRDAAAGPVPQLAQRLAVLCALILVQTLLGVFLLRGVLGSVRNGKMVLHD
ncbi:MULTISPECIES: ABC transporter permease [unclassified Streptomyces]|uniref:ABC transporter permease n=1 Tax=unclassified Streptomyces TaxID=2593676 RepID=UPI002E152AC2|nr:MULTISPECIES: ABC transporter permease [unclassified Streptomyces]WSR29174.1 ABC transporter permease [Streptomyces sp. NBC_01205]